MFQPKGNGISKLALVSAPLLLRLGTGGGSWWDSRGRPAGCWSHEEQGHVGQGSLNGTFEPGRGVHGSPPGPCCCLENDPGLPFSPLSSLQPASQGATLWPADAHLGLSKHRGGKPPPRGGEQTPACEPSYSDRAREKYESVGFSKSPKHRLAPPLPRRHFSWQRHEPTTCCLFRFSSAHHGTVCLSFLLRLLLSIPAGRAFVPFRLVLPITLILIGENHNGEKEEVSKNRISLQHSGAFDKRHVRFYFGSGDHDCGMLRLPVDITRGDSKLARMRHRGGTRRRGPAGRDPERGEKARRAFPDSERAGRSPLSGLG